MKKAIRALLVAAATAFIHPASAQTAGNITFVVPAGPGGAFDIVARMFTDKLKDILGKPVVIDNRPGGNGVIGMRYVAQGKPDGSIFGIVSSTFVSNQFVTKGYAFDQIKDMTPIINLVEAASFITVPGNSPFRSFNDMVLWAKANPGKLNVGTSFVTNIMDCAVIFDEVGISVQYINYNGSGPLTKAILSEEINMGTPSFTAIKPHLASNGMRALAIVAKKRTSVAPDIPAIVEFVPNTLASGGGIGVSGPKGMPREAVMAINVAFNTAFAQDPTIMERLYAALGADKRGGAPEEWVKAQENDEVKYRAAAKIANIQPQ
jgi:tripartite-type tricarboxylate transporter receptor subunit TctC